VYSYVLFWCVCLWCVGVCGCVCGVCVWCVGVCVLHMIWSAVMAVYPLPHIHFLVFICTCTDTIKLRCVTHPSMTCTGEVMFTVYV
jgi:hypothetical protein